MWRVGVIIITILQMSESVICVVPPRIMPFTVKSGLSPHFPLRRPLCIAPREGENARIQERYGSCNPLCDRRTTSPRCCRVNPKGDWGVRPKGGVYVIYLPTYPFYITTTRRSREYAFGKTVIDPQHVVRREIVLQELWDSPSVIASRVSRTRRSLFFIATGYYAA